MALRMKTARRLLMLTGLGIKYLAERDQAPDALPQILYDPPQQNLIIEAQRASNRAEDLRVLYVALTRAQRVGSLQAQSMKTSWPWPLRIEADRQDLAKSLAEQYCHHWLRLGSMPIRFWIGSAWNGAGK